MKYLKKYDLISASRNSCLSYITDDLINEQPDGDQVHDHDHEAKVSGTGRTTNSYEIYVGIVGIAPAAIGALAYWLTRVRHRICCSRTSANKPTGQSASQNNNQAITVATSNSSQETGQLMTVDIPGFSEKQLRKLRLLGTRQEHQANIQAVEHEMHQQNYLKNIVRKRRVYSIEYPRKSLTLESVVGEGNFGQVWRARLSTNLNDLTPATSCPVVAVKTNKLASEDQDKADLLQELDVMLQLSKQHPNVINLLGCCTETGKLVGPEMGKAGGQRRRYCWPETTGLSGRRACLLPLAFCFFQCVFKLIHFLSVPFFLIMEFADKGKLLSVLRDLRPDVPVDKYYNEGPTCSGQIFPVAQLLQYLYQITNGMEFVASHGIIHRDLAARNILVTASNTCKVADFGLARSLGDKDDDGYEQKTRGALPIRWLAPESLAMSLFS